MEALGGVDLLHGVPALLASLCVITTLQLLTRVGEFLWKMKEKKDQLSEAGVQKLTNTVDANTKAIEKLETTFSTLAETLSKVPKHDVDLKRLFSAVKIVAGDRWTKIRKEIMDEHEF
jgi:hypothetical protein